MFRTVILKDKRGYFLGERDQSGGRDRKRFVKNGFLGKEKPTFYKPFIYKGYAEDLIPNIKDKTVHLIATDPPYGGVTRNQWDIKPDWDWLAEQFDRILVSNGLVAIFGVQPGLFEVMGSFLKFFDFRFEAIWRKKNPIWTSNYVPLRSHENIWVFKRKGVKAEDTTFNRKKIGVKGKPYKIKRITTTTNQGLWNKKYEGQSDGIRFPISVLDFEKVSSNHSEYLNFPTQKPEVLMTWIIRGLSNPHDIIFDPYLGSGTTAVVALENQRRFIGAELCPTVIPILQKRLEERYRRFKSIITGDSPAILKEQMKNLI